MDGRVKREDSYHGVFFVNMCRRFCCCFDLGTLAHKLIIVYQVPLSGDVGSLVYNDEDKVTCMHRAGHCEWSTRSSVV